MRGCLGHIAALEPQLLMPERELLASTLGVDIVIGEKEYPTKAIKKPSNKIDKSNAYPHKSIESMICIHNLPLLSIAITSYTDLKTGP